MEATFAKTINPKKSRRNLSSRALSHSVNSLIVIVSNFTTKICSNEHPRISSKICCPYYLIYTIGRMVDIFILYSCGYFIWPNWIITCKMLFIMHHILHINIFKVPNFILVLCRTSSTICTSTVVHYFLYMSICKKVDWPPTYYMEQHMESVLKEKKGTKGEYRTLSKWLCLVFPADDWSIKN